MRATVALRNVVSEAEHGFMVTVVPPERTIDGDAVALVPDHNRRRDQGRFVAVEISHESLDTTFVAQLLAFLDRMTPIGQHDSDAGIEEGELSQPMLQGGEVEFDHGESVRGGKERHLSAALAQGLAHNFEWSDCLTLKELHEMFLAVAPDRELEPRRERVHD